MLLPCTDRTLPFGVASWPFGIHCKRVLALGALCEVLVDVFVGRVGCDATSDAGINNHKGVRILVTCHLAKLLNGFNRSRSHGLMSGS